MEPRPEYQTPEQRKGAPTQHAKQHMFSVQLQSIAHRLGEHSIRLGELASVFQGRGTNALVILLGLPFLQPIPLPMFSVPFGIVIILTGLHMAMRRKLWLPDSLASKQLPPGALRRILSASGRLISWLERLTCPRWIYASQLRVFRRVTGLLIAIAGALLTLPLPIPFSNFFPAVAIVLLALGGLRRDGLCSVAGIAALFIAVGYLTALAFGGGRIFNYLVN